MSQEEKKSLIDLSGFDVNSAFVKTLKRFFYQVIGIYIPGALLLIYILFFWDNGILIHNIWPQLVSQTNLDAQTSQALQIFLFLISVVILGEAMNTFTSNFTILSPVKLTRVAKIKYIFKRERVSSVFLSLSEPRWGFSEREIRWPIWLNETYYPISFAIFDRDFLTKLDIDKKPLAGKIGWIAFYRNLALVFLIISVVNIWQILITDKPSLDAASLISSNTILFSPQMVFEYSLVPLFMLFYLGYRSQKRANTSIFWSAYRRNELQKSLEAKYGDLTLSLGIVKEHQRQAWYYITDKWYLAVESARRVVSSSILSKAECFYIKRYGKDLQKKDRTSTETAKPRPEDLKWTITTIGVKFVMDDIEQKKNNRIMGGLGEQYQNVKTKTKEGGRSIRTEWEERREKRNRDELIKASTDWNNGDYEMVMSRSYNVILDIEEQIKEQIEDDKELSEEKKNELEENEKEELEDYWKLIKGLYIFVDALYTEAAYQEIKSNVTDWGWIYRREDTKVHNSDNNHSYLENASNPTSSDRTEYVHASRISIHNEEEKTQALMWEATDDFSLTTKRIMEVIRKMDECRRVCNLSYDEENYCFRELRRILTYLGGYDYENANNACEDLIKQIELKNHALKNYKKYIMKDINHRGK